MNEIDIRKIDLNLLPVFESLMSTRSVSTTARHLNRTQSAISHALERLRQQVNDPLLVRQGASMVPSPFAEDLAQEIRPLMRHLTQALSPKTDFDPAQSTRSFRLGMRDILSGLFPDLLHLSHEEAPHIKLDWLPVDQNIFHSLINGDMDIFLGPAPLNAPSGIEVEAVGGLSWSCVVRKGHPSIKTWGKQAWSAWPHIQVGTGDPLRNPITEAAAEFGLHRRIGVSVPMFSAVPAVLACSDYIATLPRSVMRDALRPWDLVELKLPFPVAPIMHALYYAKRKKGDAGLKWFRAKLMQALHPFIDVTSP